MSQDILNALKSACGLVDNGRGVKGTGYLIAPDRMVTCQHVIGDCDVDDSVKVTFNDGETQDARVASVDAQNDVAVLRFAATLDKRQPLSLAHTCDTGVRWQTYGYPGLASGIGIPLTGQVIDAAGKDTLKRPALQLYCDMVAAGKGGKAQGFSGSPVVVAGKVVGHLERVLVDDLKWGRAAFGLLFATPSDAILKLLGMPQSQDRVEAELPAVLFKPKEIPPNDYHAFMSYSHVNAQWARQLCGELKAVGQRVFLSEWDIQLGDDWTRRLYDGLSHSHAAIVLLSRAWFASRWCQEEGNKLLNVRLSKPDFRFIPVLLEDVELPLEWQSLQYADCRALDYPRGPVVEQIQHAVNGQLPPVSTTKDVIAQHAAQRAAQGVALTNTDLDMAQSLIAIGRPEAALRLLPEVSTDRRVRQLRAYGLNKAGQFDAAVDILKGIEKEGYLDGETGGLLAGCYRRKWELTKENRWLIAARQTYLRAWEDSASKDPYPGVNAASMLLWAGEADKAREIASKVLRLLQKKPKKQLDQWNLATIAEAQLILKDLPAAREWYEHAVAKHPDAVGAIATIRKSARRDLKALGQPSSTMDDVLPVPLGAIFVGHLIDGPTHTTGRFPATREEEVRSRIRDAIEDLVIGVGVSSASPGSDLLFLEEMALRRGAQVRIVLPCALARFQREFVTPPWYGRLEKVLESRHAELVETERRDPQDVWADFEDLLWRETERLTRLLDQEPCLLAVWDGQPNNFVGRTITRWKENKGRVKKIMLS